MAYFVPGPSIPSPGTTQSIEKNGYSKDLSAIVRRTRCREQDGEEKNPSDGCRGSSDAPELLEQRRSGLFDAALERDE